MLKIQWSQLIFNMVFHNYNNLMVKYYKERIDALAEKIHKLELLLEFKDIQIEKLKSESYGTNIK